MLEKVNQDKKISAVEKIKILCVEDNVFDYKIFEAKLLKGKKDDYEVFHAQTFEIALEYLEKQTFAICFVDYSLEGDQTGLELIEISIQHNIACPFIMLTGFDDESFIKKSLSLGLYDYVLKSEATTSMLHRTISYTLERWKIEQELKNSRHRYKLESIGQMAGGMAHELNNLLQPIMMKAEDIADESENKDHVDAAEKILECAKNAAKIIGDVLSFSHRGDALYKIVDVRQACVQQIDFAAEMIPKGIQISMHGFKKTTDALLVKIDCNDMFRVFSNLFTNATHAMDYCGDINITLKDQKESVQIFIEDTGSGIPEDKIDNIFDPFFTTKETGEGTGLGLSIIHGIIDGWGGSIILDQQINKGACFVIEIPLYQEQEDVH